MYNKYHEFIYSSLCISMLSEYCPMMNSNKFGSCADQAIFLEGEGLRDNFACQEGGLKTFWVILLCEQCKSNKFEFSRGFRHNYIKSLKI